MSVVSATAIAATAAVINSAISAYAAIRTAEINADAQKYTADRAKEAQIGVAKEQSKAEIHGYDTDKEIEQMIIAEDSRQFDKQMDSSKELENAQWALLEVTYGPSDDYQPDGVFDKGYDYGHETQSPAMEAQGTA